MNMEKLMPIAFVVFGGMLAIVMYCMSFSWIQMILMLVETATTTHFHWLLIIFAIISLIVGVGAPTCCFLAQKTRRIGLVCFSIFFSFVHTFTFFLIFNLFYMIYMFCNMNIIENFGFTLISTNLLPYSMRIIIVSFLLILSIIVDIIGFKRGHSMEIKEMTFTSSKLKQNIDFVHISDIHIGSRFVSHVRNVVDMILPLKPDFVVITGDLTDSPKIDKSEFVPFEGLTRQCPVYMSTGNHDYMAGIIKVKQFCESCGIKILENESIINNELQYSVTGTNDSQKNEYIKAMSQCSFNISDETYNIILQHRPHGYDETCENGKYDMMLAGHTHAGQIAPFSYLVYLAFKKPYGLYEILKNGNKMWLYTNPATGAWGPHFRTKGKNEITFIHLRPEK